MAIAMTSCFDEPTGESTKHLPNPGGGDLEIPDNVVSPVASFPLRAEAVVINPEKTYQTMEGIGASDCWLGEFIGQYWSGKRAEVANLLFSQRVINGEPQGIGLSMWRVNLGGGSAEQGAESGIADRTSRAASYLDANGSYDWSKCPGQRYFMQQAKNNGVESFVLFANSPLVQWTKNGLATKIGSKSDWHTNLKDEHYGDYAEYLATVAEHFTGEGYNISYISPANEPQYEWNGDNQEGSSWYNTEMARLARELDKSLESRALNTNILLGEAGHFVSLYAGDSHLNHYMIDHFFTPGDESYIGDLKHVDNIIAGHSYWTNNTWNEMRDVRQRVANKASQRGVRVWQTEWSLLGDCPADLGGYEDAFTNAMYMSRVMHCDFTVAQCPSWCYWTAMSVSRWDHNNRFELIYTTPAGGQYADNWETDGTVAGNENLWVLGNYSLHIRPGYKRVDIDHKESKDFFASAWLSPDSRRLVVVYTNYDKQNGVTLNSVNGIEGNPIAIRRYTTTATKNLKEDFFKVGDQVFIEPYSVTTVVYDY